MKTIDFSVDNRLPWEAILFVILKSLKVVVKEFWGIFLLLYLQMDKRDIPLWLMIIIGLFVILLIAIFRGLFIYKNFRYRVTADELIIQKGILKKTSTNIPLNRIQNVNISQGFWQQMLDITTLSVDTAGTEKKEMEIYLDLETSNALKEALTILSESRPQIESENPPVTPPPLTVNYVYGMRELLAAAFTRNPLKGFSLAFILVFSLINQLSDSLREKFYDSVFSWLEGIDSVFYSITLFLSIAFIIIVVYVIKTISSYYQLKVSVSKNKIKYERGLIKKLESFIRINKIQVIKRSQNWLEKMRGLSSIDIMQHFTFLKEKDNNLHIHGFEHSEALETLLLDELDKEEFTLFQPEKNYLKRNVNFIAIIPTLVIALGTFFETFFAGLAAAYFVVGILLAYSKTKKAKAEVGDKYIRIYSGTWASECYTFEIGKIQFVELNQSVFQKRKGTASLTLANRWHSLTIPFIKESSAKQLKDFILLKLEAKGF